MKKLYSILLALVFVISLGTVTMAELVDPGNLTDVGSITLTKNYDYPDSPNTTFEFEIERFELSDTEVGSLLTKDTMPLLSFASDVDTITFGSDDPFDGQKELTINLPNYTEIGIYTYEITEINKTTPWVTYDGRSMFVKVTVLRDGDGFKRIVAVRFDPIDDTSMENGKGGEFSNIYNHGTLDVSKEVTGNFGDQNKEFEVTVTFTSPTGFPVDGQISYTLPGDADPTTLLWVNGVAEVTIPLKHLESVIFSNIPYGVKYTVSEADYTTPVGGEYDVALIEYSDAGKIINAVSAADRVDITNNKDINVDTGISLDSMPYILLLGFAVLGIGILFFRKRQNLNF